MTDIESALNPSDPSQRLLRRVSLALLALALLGITWDLYVFFFQVPHAKVAMAGLGSKLPATTMALLCMPRTFVLATAGVFSVFLVAKELLIRRAEYAMPAAWPASSAR